jgi:hypothetical protein
MTVVSLIIFLHACDPNSHKASDHPCNFPDAETENSLRSPFSFKILDLNTFENIVDTTANALIHPDSVKLYNADWLEIDPEPRFRFDGEWIFDNFPPYLDVPVNDPEALLELDRKTFYLMTSFDDVDTVDVFFNSCLVTEVSFNKTSTERPESVPTSASFYFKKKF